jgi:hypothetical protein
MLITLLLFFAAIVVVPFLSFLNDNEVRDTVTFGIVFTLIAVFIVCLTMFQSYNSYVTMKQCCANFEHLAETVTSYEKFAALNTRNVEVKSSEITDLKYQNYQGSVKDLIQDLRDVCVLYNDILVSKIAYGNNAFFSWLIIMPDEDMKIVKMSDFLEIKN